MSLAGEKCLSASAMFRRKTIPPGGHRTFDRCRAEHPWARAFSFLAGNRRLAAGPSRFLALRASPLSFIRLPFHPIPVAAGQKKINILRNPMAIQ